MFQSPLLYAYGDRLGLVPLFKALGILRPQETEITDDHLNEFDRSLMNISSDVLNKAFSDFVESLYINGASNKLVIRIGGNGLERKSFESLKEIRQLVSKMFVKTYTRTINDRVLEAIDVAIKSASKAFQPVQNDKIMQKMKLMLQNQTIGDKNKVIIVPVDNHDVIVGPKKEEPVNHTSISSVNPHPLVPNKVLSDHMDSQINRNRNKESYKYGTTYLDHKDRLKGASLFKDPQVTINASAGKIIDLTSANFPRYTENGIDGENFTPKTKKECWKNAPNVFEKEYYVSPSGKEVLKETQDWKYDALGNVVFYPFSNCNGRYCYQFDHKHPKVRGGKNKTENCQILQTAINGSVGEKADRNANVKAYDLDPSYDLLTDIKGVDHAWEQFKLMNEKTGSKMKVPGWD